MNRKKIFLWSLYDFANSIVFINFLLYFTQWLVLDGGLSDFWFNATFAISTILLFLSAPILAAFTDKFGHRMFFLNFSTLGTALCYGLAALLAMQNSNILLIALFFLLGQYFYQLSFVFYNPLIEELSDNSHRGRVSGIGQFSNAIGQVVGLAIMLPLAGTRLSPLLPSIGIFILLALPFMIFYKENTQKVMIKSEMKGFGLFYRKLIPFFSLSIAAPLLFAFFFYNDALVTVTNNYSIYMQKVFAIPDSSKSLLLMLIVVMNAIGGLLSGWIGDKIGIKKTLYVVLCFWILVIPVIALTTNMFIFMILTAFLGLFIGAMWAISRAYMSLLLSKEDMGYGFSFYTILERFSTLVGPLTWGGIIALLGTDSQSYRVAMCSMTAFVIIGLLILTIWKREKLKY